MVIEYSSQIIPPSTKDIISSINLSEIINNIPGINTLVKIISAIGILVVIYLIFLIIRAFFAIKHNLRIINIAKNVDEINKKLDVLIREKKKK